MNLLVLGGAGYLGSALAIAAVRAGHDVTVVDNLLYEQGHTQLHLPLLGVNLVERDVCDVPSYAGLLWRADAVIHLAAIVGAPACDRYPDLATRVNVDSVRDVVHGLRPEQKFILPNTNSGYGTGGTEACTESTLLRPISHYGLTKQVAEEIALAHQNTTVFRLATVFGVSPRMRLDLLVNRLAYDAFFRGEVIVFDGDLRRNFVHVRDVAAAFLWAAARPCDQVVFNMGLDEANMSKQALAELVSAVAKRSHGLDVVVRQGNGYDPDRRDYLVSSAKLANAGFQALSTLEQGIVEVLNFCRLLPRERAQRDALVISMSTTRSHRPVI